METFKKEWLIDEPTTIKEGHIQDVLDAVDEWLDQIKLSDTINTKNYD